MTPPKETLGAVFDCNIFFQATRNANGPAAKVLRLLEQAAFTLFVTNEILDEVRDTFTDPKVRSKNRWLTDEVTDAFLHHLRQHAVLLPVAPECFSYERDPDDAKYVNLAVTAGARYLVSRDNDLLDLMNEENPGGKDFRGRFPGLAILDPVAFLRILSTKEGRSQAPEDKPAATDG